MPPDKRESVAKFREQKRQGFTAQNLSLFLFLLIEEKRYDTKKILE